MSVGRFAMYHHFFHAITIRSLAIVAILALLPFSGCQQPNGRFGSRLFGSGPRRGIFGSGSRYAQAPFDRDRYAAQVPGGIPDLQINDGSGRDALLAEGASRVQDLNQRLGAYDKDNQLLNTEVAALEQKLQLANQYNQTLKEQLAGVSSQVQQTFAERQAAAQQIAMLQSQLQQATQALRTAQQRAASSGQLVGHRGGVPSQLAGNGGGGRATLRANNSLLQKLSAIQIPGGEARMDGDVIRIEFPSDRMFVPGTYQIQPAQMPLLQNIVGTIKESFPRQIIGVEAHWDNTPLTPPGTTAHQLTATQALAVLDQLVRIGLPRNQVFSMAMASNRPRYPQGMRGGISPNRRIEIVIYPETYDGS